MNRTYESMERHTVDESRLDDFEIREIDEVQLKAAQVD